ncbi:sce7726 family protein [Ensifer aridi]|uniref:sce7726 family protein n=1 Tax=Ensifer aridi TaxID=1708715 RepID=UPI00358E8912
MRDIDIRRALLVRLLQAHNKDEDTRIVQEMGVWAGTVRIDVAVLNGEMSGYELKSDSDTLARLPLQADLYSKVFDRMTLVVGSKHLEKAATLIPSWWGIVRATSSEKGVKLRRVRASRRNVNHEPYVVAELLRKDEAVAVLEQHGLAAGWRSKRVKLIHERLARELPVRELSKHVLRALKNRQDWLRENSVHQLDMAVDAQLNPMF